MSRYLAIIVTIASFAATTGAVWPGHGAIHMRGQIVAYRPGERLLQFASFVVNRESFLFAVTSDRSKSQPVVAKLVYEHFGYSELSYDVLQKAPSIQLRAHRDPKCDETFADYVEHSPTFKTEDGKEEMIKVVFVGPFQTVQLSPQQPLKCYKVQEGSIRIDSDLNGPSPHHR